MENCDEAESNRLFTQYGFKNCNDFQLIIRALIRLYRYLCIESISGLSSTDEDLINCKNKEEHVTTNLLILLEEIAETRSDLLKLSLEQQKMFTKTFFQRKEELLEKLIREHYAQKSPLVTSFDWDVRLIMDSYRSDCQFLTTLTLNFYKNTQQSDNQLNCSLEHSQFHCQINAEMLDKFIESIEDALQKSNSKENTNALGLS